MTQILILASCVYLTMLVATIYFTRPTSRRVGGALAGGVAVAMVGVGVEALAHAEDWWRYTSDETPIGPVAMYPVIVVVFAFLALIGWIVARRFGWRGTTGFLVILAVVGAPRDYFIAGKLMGLIVFAPVLFSQSSFAASTLAWIADCSGRGSRCSAAGCVWGSRTSQRTDILAAADGRESAASSSGDAAARRAGAGDLPAD